MAIEQVDGVWWPADDHETRAVMAQEVAKVEAIVPWCRRRDVAVQAGANVGLVAEELARHFRFVATFEVNPEVIEAARLNIKAPNVKLTPCGLGERVGPVGLKSYTFNSGATQTCVGQDAMVAPLDAFDLPLLDLLMLDLEGDELPALKGGWRTVELHRPVVVVEQKGIKAPDRWHRPALEQLAGIGYRQVAKLGNDYVMVPSEHIPEGHDAAV